MKDYVETYQEWLSNPYSDEDTKAELRVIEDDGNKIKERFYMDPEFGTARLRGVIGTGTNRVNTYVVRRAIQGLASYIIKQDGVDKGVAAVHDSCHMPPESVVEAAMTLVASGTKTYKFESLCPTPELPFAVRELGCITGINIMTSRNPPEYNGYKVYWENGAQLTPPYDKGVTEEVLTIKGLFTVKITDEASVAVTGKCEVIGREIDDKYIAQVKAQVVNQKAIDEMQDQVSIVYILLHGTDSIPTKRAMKELGFTHVYVVPEQELPDGDFPTASHPNSEVAEAFTLGLRLVREKDADLILATDSGADRLGVYVRDVASGEYIPLTGNMSGSLLCEYILSRKKAAGRTPEGGQAIKPIVSTDLTDVAVRECGCEPIEVLTGFKWIGQQVLKNEETDHGTYLSGMEENYGCPTGTYARDKDTIFATVVLYETTAYYEQKGMTLWDAMVTMYEKYSYYRDAVKSIGLFGIEDLTKIQSIMETFRNSTPKEAGDYKVVSARDYELDTIKDTAAGEAKPIGLPSSNVLYYDLNDGAWICARSSGVEPKVEFYYGIKGSSVEDTDVGSETLGVAVMAMVDKMT